MKKIIGCSILTLLLGSCVHYGMNAITNREYVVENKSDYDLTIKGFLNNELIDDISVKKGQSYSKKVVNDPIKGGWSNSIFSTANGNDYRDSVLIIFDKGRAINQTCQIDNGNPDKNNFKLL
jgi:hypothetical protein